MFICDASTRIAYNCFTDLCIQFLSYLHCHFYKVDILYLGLLRFRGFSIFSLLQKKKKTVLGKLHICFCPQLKRWRCTYLLGFDKKRATPLSDPAEQVPLHLRVGTDAIHAVYFYWNKTWVIQIRNQVIQYFIDCVHY
jgi:hypothetical protein